MTLPDALAAAQVPEAAELLAPHWEQSQQSLPATTPSFLLPEVCLRLREFTGLAPELDEALVATARIVAADAALTQLAWHCTQLLYEHRDYPADNIRHWPCLQRVLGDQHLMFYLLIALTATSRTRAWHEAHGLSEEVTRDTVRQHGELTKLHWDETARRWTGSSMSLYWTRLHVWGELFALGRLEYMVRPFGGCLQAYRHRQTGEVVALATPGIRFSSEGYRDEPQDSPAMLAGFTSTLTTTADAVTGHYLSPLGHATGEQLTLPLAEWDLVLVPGQPMLDTHLPAGAGMTPERCQDSMRRALEFFPHYFPDRPFVGFACHSWVLNPDLETMLGPESNMVRWQRELYLFPYPSTARASLASVFADREPALAPAPRDARLRRAMLEHLEAGGRLRNGGMFLLTEDFARYGTGVHRSR
jgi:hypothetical protein